MPPIEIEASHQSSIDSLTVDSQHKCIWLSQDSANGALKDKDCGSSAAQVCTINYGMQGLGASIVVPAYFAGTITCPLPPDTPPAEAMMEISADQPDLMCPGKKAKYDCAAGGINVLLDQPTKSSYEVTCKTDQTYHVPTTWPVCVEKLDCEEPKVDETVMSFDWTEGSSTTPPFTVKYACVRERKKIVLSSDLNQGLEGSVTDELDVTCQDNGTYDKNIEDYVCTRVCPRPTNPDPEIIEVSHNATLDPKPEIYETIRYWCKDDHKLVSKVAFRSGEPTRQLDELMSMCQISGWLNETIGSYTCTKHCDTPVNYTTVFDYNYEEGGSTEIGTTLEYRCLDSRRKVVNVEIENSDLLDFLNVTCLYNGVWNQNVLDFGCTECLKRDHPANGQLICESKRFAQDSKCFLKCEPGYIAIDQVSMTCLFNEKHDDFEWSNEPETMQCVKAIGYLIGGIKSDYEYTNQVELFAPGLQCINSAPPPYPLKVMGTVSAFLHGQNIACGGAVMHYTDCSKHAEGSWDCKTDLDCVVTQGGAKWCTGPKTKHCYSLTYDVIANTESWVQVASMSTARAYATGAVLFNGQFWITGGISRSKILDSIEIFVVRDGVWVGRNGPKMPRALTGHCFGQVSESQVLVAGGYSPDEDGYTDKVDIYDLSTKKWFTRAWMHLNVYGPRFDSSCINVLIGIQSKLVMTGGWNNTDMSPTQYFDFESKQWVSMGHNITGQPFRHAWHSYSVRSGAIIDLGQAIYHLGGVKCTG